MPNESKEIVIPEQWQVVRSEGRGWMTTVDLNMRVDKVKEVMATQMHDKIHYGKIPGCPKPSLWQPGAEILGMAFQLAPRFKHEKTWRTGPHGPVFEVFTICELYSTITGGFVGDSTRSCSTDEEKYAWRGAKCLEEFKATAESLRRTTWKQNDDRTWREVQQIRTAPGDMVNTTIGMSEKRSYVSAIRRATAASEVFTEGLEQLPADILQAFIDEDDDPELGKIVADVLRKRQGARPATNTSSNRAATPAPAGTPGAFIIPFGKNTGKTLAEIGERSVQWYAENAKQDDVRDAAKAYLVSLDTPAPATAPVSGDANATPPDDMPDISDPFANQ